MKSENLFLVGIVLLLFCAGASAEAAVATNAALADISLEDLINIKVTSVSKKETSVENSPAAISVVTAEDISRLGITSLPEALRLAPGLDVAQISANEWAVSIRGFNAQFADKMLVLIDGRSVYAPASGGVFWNAQNVMMEDLERIEVIRGPGAELWGANAVDGVINIVSKSAEETQGWLINSEGGSQVKPIAALRYGGELASNVYYRVYGQRSDYAGYSESTGQNADDDWNSTFGGFRMDWEPPTPNMVTFQGDYYDEVAGDQTRRLSLAPASVVFPAAVEHNNGGNLLGRWTHNFSATSQLALQGYFDHVSQGDTLGVETRNTYDIDLQDRFAMGSWNDVVWGGGYRYASVENSPSPELGWTPETQYVEIFNMFAQDDITIAPDRLQFTAGAKLEYDNLAGWEPQPDARFLWTPTEKQSAWAAVSRATATPALLRQDGRLNATAFQPPPPSLPALVSVLPNSGLEAEALTAYQLGYRVEPARGLSFDITGFYDVYDDLFVSVPGPTRVEGSPAPPHLLISSSWENAGAAQTDGVELSGSWKVTDSWRLAASYSWLDMRLNSAAGQLGKSPQQQAQLRSYLDLPHDLQLNGAVYFVDRCTSPLGTGLAEIPAYARVDLGLVWHPQRWLEMGIWGQNLIESKHLEFASQQTGVLTEVPRSMLAKIILRF